MLRELDFYLPKSFCLTNVYGLATVNTPKETNSNVGLTGMGLGSSQIVWNCVKKLRFVYLRQAEERNFFTSYSHNLGPTS